MTIVKTVGFVFTPATSTAMSNVQIGGFYTALHKGGFATQEQKEKTMAKEYIKVGNGVAYENDKKGNEKSPDLSGPITIIDKDGSERELRVAIWEAAKEKDYKYKYRIWILCTRFNVCTIK